MKMHISDMLFGHAAKKYNVVCPLQESSGETFQGLKSPRLWIHVSDVWSSTKQGLPDCFPLFWLAWQGLWREIKCRMLSEESLASFLLRQGFLKQPFAFCASLWVVPLCWSTTATLDTLLICYWGNRTGGTLWIWMDPGGYSRTTQEQPPCGVEM